MMNVLSIIISFFADESGCSANVSLQSGDLTFTSAFDNTLQCLDDDEFYDAQ